MHQDPHRKYQEAMEQLASAMEELEDLVRELTGDDTGGDD